MSWERILECFESSRYMLANQRVPSLAGAETATTNLRNNLNFPGNRENFALLANWRVDHHSRHKLALERGLITAVLSTTTIGFRPVADQHRASQSAGGTEQTLAELAAQQTKLWKSFFCLPCQLWSSDSRFTGPQARQSIA